MQQQLWYRQQDTDLNGVRGIAPDERPEVERQPWRKLWADVEALRQRAAKAPAP